VHTILATRGADQLLTDVPVERLPELAADPEWTVWVDLCAPITDVEKSIVSDLFKFHPLAVEDCFEEREHPKIEDYGSYLYLIAHGLQAGGTAEESESVEIDAFVGKDFIVTHHSAPSRSIAGTREAVLRTGMPLRKGPVAVLHAILDRQVDGMEIMLDHMEERITQIEDAVFERPESTQIEAITAFRGNILQLRRWMSKQREVVYRLGRREFALVGETEALLFRDVHDHLVRYNDLLENYREMLSSILDAYLSMSSHRLSEIMRFLAVFTAILMPLTVITGIYGMNFDLMPELRHPRGYPGVLMVMLLIAAGIMFYFRRKGWLGRPPPLPPPRPTEPPPPRSTASHRRS